MQSTGEDFVSDDLACPNRVMVRRLVVEVENRSLEELSLPVYEINLSVDEINLSVDEINLSVDEINIRGEDINM